MCLQSDAFESDAFGSNGFGSMTQSPLKHIVCAHKTKWWFCAAFTSLPRHTTPVSAKHRTGSDATRDTLLEANGSSKPLCPFYRHGRSAWLFSLPHSGWTFSIMCGCSAAMTSPNNLEPKILRCDESR